MPRICFDWYRYRDPEWNHDDSNEDWLKCHVLFYTHNRGSSPCRFPNSVLSAWYRVRKEPTHNFRPLQNKSFAPGIETLLSTPLNIISRRLSCFVVT